MIYTLGFNKKTTNIIIKFSLTDYGISMLVKYMNKAFMTKNNGYFVYNDISIESQDAPEIRRSKIFLHGKSYKNNYSLARYDCNIIQAKDLLVKYIVALTEWSIWLTSDNNILRESKKQKQREYIKSIGNIKNKTFNIML